MLAPCSVNLWMTLWRIFVCDQISSCLTFIRKGCVKWVFIFEIKFLYYSILDICAEHRTSTSLGNISPLLLQNKSANKPTKIIKLSHLKKRDTLLSAIIQKSPKEPWRGRKDSYQIKSLSPKKNSRLYHFLIFEQWTEIYGFWLRKKSLILS